MCVWLLLSVLVQLLVVVMSDRPSMGRFFVLTSTCEIILPSAINCVAVPIDLTGMLSVILNTPSAKEDVPKSPRGSFITVFLNALRNAQKKGELRVISSLVKVRVHFPSKRVGSNFTSVAKLSIS